MATSSPTGTWIGDCGFRLMPHDDLFVAPSAATTSSEAGGWGWSLRYTWTHADDGEQSGTLLLASPDDAGAMTVAWLDSWHQKPELRLLTGTVDAGVVRVEMDYSGWGWTIEVAEAGNTLRMVMSNVVPAGHDGFEGAYVVMDATWTRSEPV